MKAHIKNILLITGLVVLTCLFAFIFIASFIIFWKLMLAVILFTAAIATAIYTWMAIKQEDNTPSDRDICD